MGLALLTMLPPAMCLVWAVVRVMLFRGRGYGLPAALFLVSGVFLFCKACIDGGADGALIHVLRVLSFLCIVPLTIIYQGRCTGNGNKLRHTVGIIVVAAVLPVVTAAINTSVEKMLPASSSYAADSYAFILICLFSAWLLAYNISVTYHNSLKYEELRSAIKEPVFWSEILLGWCVFAISACLLLPPVAESILISLFLLFAGCADIKSAVRRDESTVASTEEVLTAEDEPEPDSAIYDDSLLSRFQYLMNNERLFLKPGLTITEVAELLHSNKTYVSRMVNDNYKMGFPDVINHLRVDYAEQYILEHRNARQDEIAAACGFMSASSFNNTFKRITGMPPKQWVTDWNARH